MSDVFHISHTAYSVFKMRILSICVRDNLLNICMFVVKIILEIYIDDIFAISSLRMRNTRYKKDWSLGIFFFSNFTVLSHSMHDLCIVGIAIATAAPTML